jgi:hypothetical protein
MGVFGAPEKHLFDHAERVHPIYFDFPFQRVDDVNLELPLGWQITTVPAPQKLGGQAIEYATKAENSKGTLHISRSLRVEVLLLEQKYYPSLRNFFQIVRTGDEQQVILQPGGTNASN